MLWASYFILKLLAAVKPRGVKKMVLAYILITIRGEDASRVAQDLTAYEEVSSLHIVYGSYDIIARIKAKNMIELREFAITKLLKTKGIEKTETLIVADITKENDDSVKEAFDEIE